jgi:adenylate cyclase
MLKEIILNVLTYMYYWTIDDVMTSGKYFNKGVRARNEDDLGHVMKETNDKIIVFGYSNTRYDIPKYHVSAVGRSIKLNIDFPEIYKYQVNRNSRLPTDGRDQQVGTRENSMGIEKPDHLSIKENTTLEPQKYHYGGLPETRLEQYKSNEQQTRQILDLQTLLTQRQDRLREALEERYQYNTSIKRSQDFLQEHVRSKICLVIMYVDLVGSTDMSMTLPVEKLVAIITAFSREVSSVIESYSGYVLKYVGDAVIAFFPSNFNKYLACDRSFECAKSIINVIKYGINPVLQKMAYPELSVKIGMDEGENVIVQYGYDLSSPIDVIGYSMNISAKITSLTRANKISVGEDVFKLLHPKIKSTFKELQITVNQWKYIDRQTRNPYQVYSIL